MNTIILTLQTTSETADPVKKTAIAADKHQTSKPFFKQIIKTRTFSDLKCWYEYFFKMSILKSKSVMKWLKLNLYVKHRKDSRPDYFLCCSNMKIQEFLQLILFV